MDLFSCQKYLISERIFSNCTKDTLVAFRSHFKTWCYMRSSLGFPGLSLGPSEHMETMGFCTHLISAENLTLYSIELLSKILILAYRKILKSIKTTKNYERETGLTPYDLKIFHRAWSYFKSFPKQRKSISIVPTQAKKRGRSESDGAQNIYIGTVISKFLL